MQAVVRMVHVCMDSFPTLFGPTSQAFCFQLMQRLLGLLTLQPPVECAAPCISLCGDDNSTATCFQCKHRSQFTFMMWLHRDAHEMVCDLLCSITTMLARHQPDAYALVFSGAMEVASGDPAVPLRVLLSAKRKPACHLCLSSMSCTVSCHFVQTVTRCFA